MKGQGLGGYRERRRPYQKPASVKDREQAHADALWCVAEARRMREKGKL